MVSPIYFRKQHLFFIMTSIAIVSCLLLYHLSGKSLYTKAVSSGGQFSEWPTFSLSSAITKSHFDKQCIRMENITIEKLSNFIDMWSKQTRPECRDLYHRFEAVYSVRTRVGTVILPTPFQAKVKKWLGGDESLFDQVYKQQLIHVYNKFTHEHTVFNPLRDKRPKAEPEVPELEYIEKLVAQSKDSCDFCKFKEYTAEHEIHRLETEKSYTASNTFKIEKWHALFIMKKHHPLNWSLDQFIDVMELAQKWLKMANKHDGEAMYPAVVWDMFAHAGASQVHPHMHGLLSPNAYYGTVELWRQAAEEYYGQFGTNYFTDLVSMYSALGLAFRHEDAVALANIAPKKDHEVLIISAVPGKSFYQLIYYTLRAFIEDIGKFTFSLGIGLPPVGTSLLGTNRGNIPAFARIVTRGSVSEIRTDMSSFELFAATNVNVDPYSVIRIVESSFRTRHKG